MKTNTTFIALIIAASATLAGCASVAPQQNQVQTQPAAAPSNYSSYGVVDYIQVNQAQKNNQIGVGAVVGGVVGGLLGNQVGGGSGKTAATVVGVVGGAVVGNKIEQNNRVQANDTYQIGVRMENGSYQTITQDDVADMRVGSRVRIQNNRVYRY